MVGGESRNAHKRQDGKSVGDSARVRYRDEAGSFPMQISVFMDEPEIMVSFCEMKFNFVSRTSQIVT